MKKAFLLFFCVVCFVWAQEETEPGNEEFNPVAELAKETLVLANGKSVKGNSALANKKFIALYFSAHWCGPCRAFTPELVKFRNNCVKKNLPFEVVFVSHDKTKDDMKGYMTGENMKWLAIPYDSPLRNKMSSHFKVNGIPTLVLLDGKGNVVSPNARWDVHILGNEAYKRWQSPNYKPLTYEDAKKGGAKKDAKKSNTNGKTQNKKTNKKKSSKKAK